MALLPRGVEGRVEAALRGSPVVILEGPRGCGKTSLCQRLLDRGVLAEFVSLASESTHRLALAGPEAFIEGLTPPAGIDEAQLVELTLAVKANVDRTAGSGRFLLTASSRIGRGALGGTDPLAGRAMRLRLRPFTQAELAGSEANIVSFLFAGDLARASWETLDRAELVRRLRIGGLPVLPGVIRSSAKQTAGSVIDAYVESVIHLGAGQSRIDRQELIRSFRYLACLSSQPLNQESTARSLGLHPQTLAGYLEILESLFLIERIPAFHPHARTAVRRRSKLHVVDTALAKWALGVSDRDLTAGSAQIGPLVESFVIGELIAQASMLEDGPVVTYWRDPKGRAEVDLVMQDESGRAVPVEIKAGSRLSNDVADGVIAFRREFPDAFHQGFVFYGGTELMELETDIWAVPISALWSDPIGRLIVARPEAPGTAMFVSYVHDDDRAEGGRITQLADDISERYRFLAGDDDLVVFTDRNLRWGDEWESRLTEELQRATFFVPVVTPRFLKSAACRNELLRFLSVADATGNEKLVRPILYVDPGSLDSQDPVERAISQHQWVDWTELRYSDTAGGEYRRAVDHLAGDLIAGLAEPGGSPDPDAGSGGSGDRDPDSPDLLEHVELLGTVSESLEPTVTAITESVMASLGMIEGFLPELERAGKRGPTHTRLAFGRLAASLEPLLVALATQVATLREAESQLSRSVQGLVSEVGTSSPWATEIEDSMDALDRIDLDLDLDSMADARATLTAIGRLSRDMRAPMKRVDEAIQVLLDVASLPVTWQMALAAARSKAES